MVDNFSAPSVVGRGCAAASGQLFYFCTHAHKDHTVGLSATWDRGTIYCSSLTKALLVLEHGPQLADKLRALDTDQTHLIVVDKPTNAAAAESAAAAGTKRKAIVIEPEPEGYFSATGHAASAAAVGTSAAAASSSLVASSSASIETATSFSVALYNSNHCPGSVMFLFRSASWGSILHTGDFRYAPSAFHSASLHAQIGHIDACYFDATFLEPRCVFPNKSKAVLECIAAVRALKRKQESLAVPPGAMVPGQDGLMRLHHSCDWRVYLSCEGLGSEEILEALFAEFNEPFFVDTGVGAPTIPGVAGRRGTGHGPGMTLRANQLRVIARHNGGVGPNPNSNLVVTDPAWATRTHFHLAPSKAFQQFAQADRARRMDEKRKLLAGQVQKAAAEQLRRATAASKLRGGTFDMFGSVGASSSLFTAAASASAHLVAAAASAPPPLTLYLKPSTQWFVLNHSASAAAQMQHSAALPVGSSWLARGGVEYSAALAYADESASQAALAQLAGTPDGFDSSSLHAIAAGSGAPRIPGLMPLRGDDRFGVTHVLYSMHSDYVELAEFLRFMRPRVVCPVNTPVGFEAEMESSERATSRISASQGASGSGCLYGYSAAALAADPLRSGGGGHDRLRQQQLLAHTERLLRARLDPADMPLVRGTDHKPAAAFSRLAVARAAPASSALSGAIPASHASAAAAAVNPAWEALLRPAPRIATERAIPRLPAAAAAHPPHQPPARSFSSPVKQSPARGILDDEDPSTLRDHRVRMPHALQQHGDAQPAQLPSNKRLKLAVPRSPLDLLGGGRFGSSVGAGSLENRSPRKHPPALVPQRAFDLVGFDPRRLDHVTVYLERDLALPTDMELRSELVTRLLRLGLKAVVYWTREGNVTASATVNSDAAALAPPPASIRKKQQGQKPYPAHINFVLICHDRPSCPKLLNYVIGKVQRAQDADQRASAAAAAGATGIAPPSRDWSHRPLYICDLRFVQWLEAYNEKQQNHHAASSLLPPVKLDWLAWSQLCMWNSLTESQPMQPATTPALQKHAGPVHGAPAAVVVPGQAV